MQLTKQHFSFTLQSELDLQLSLFIVQPGNPIFFGQLEGIFSVTVWTTIISFWALPVISTIFPSNGFGVVVVVVAVVVVVVVVAILINLIIFKN